MLQDTDFQDLQFKKIGSGLKQILFTNELQSVVWLSISDRVHFKSSLVICDLKVGHTHTKKFSKQKMYKNKQIPQPSAKQRR